MMGILTNQPQTTIPWGIADDNHSKRQGLYNQRMGCFEASQDRLLELSVERHIYRQVLWLIFPLYTNSTLTIWIDMSIPLYPLIYTSIPIYIYWSTSIPPYIIHRQYFPSSPTHRVLGNFQWLILWHFLGRPPQGAPGPSSPLHVMSGWKECTSRGQTFDFE